MKFKNITIENSEHHITIITDQILALLIKSNVFKLMSYSLISMCST